MAGTVPVDLWEYARTEWLVYFKWTDQRGMTYSGIREGHGSLKDIRTAILDTRPNAEFKRIRRRIVINVATEWQEWESEYEDDGRP